jgi:hypothetical protein
MDFRTKIKVDKKVKPIHHKDRKPLELILGRNYYVSFGNHHATPCKLIEVEGDEAVKRITVEIPTKIRSVKGFIDVNGNISHHWVDVCSLFGDELGMTPEEAVVNEVTA